MQIKRFEAKNMTTALRLIKDALGPEAVILSARTIRKRSGLFGSFRNYGVEVTAATDTYYSEEDKKYGSYRKESSNGDQFEVSNHLRSYQRKSRIQTRQDLKSAPAGTRHAEDRGDERLAKNKQVIFALYQQLLSQGVDRDIALDLTEALKIQPEADQRLLPGEIKPLLVSLFEQMGVVAEPIRPAHAKPKVVAFVGAAGVGKTTTIAKLAAYHAVNQNKRVALISLDDFRIAAVEQLKVYAKIMEIPLKVASRLSEFKKQLKQFNDQDLVLIDSPGMDPKNHDQLNEFAKWFEKFNSIEIQLLLSAATKEADLFNTVNRFKKVRVDRLLFTKLDESNTFGNLLNVVIRCNLPFSYFTTGQQIPDDIEEGSLDKIVELLFSPKKQGDESAKLIEVPAKKNGAGRHSDQRSGRYFVANRNSDVYHIPGCKWANKIKFENIIRFESPEAAERQKYLPCRNCNPDRPEPFGPAASERDKLTTSNDDAVVKSIL
jgi:flagellar biosynthesis protein FlhF